MQRKTALLNWLVRLALCAACLFMANQVGADDLRSANPALKNPAANTFLVLCYHDIQDSDPDPQYETVSTKHFTEQMTWLRDQGYNVVSIDDLLAARSGKKALPSKPVLLTFDDGYSSFYTRAYPVLKKFNYHAVIGLVDEWMQPKLDMQGNPSDSVDYNHKALPRSAFLSWDQVREMQRSGLVEVASHSHNLHYGALANPQGNTEPAAITSIYNDKSQSYETDEDYRLRLDEDAAASVDTLVHETGITPRVMIWPYGAYNQIGVDTQKKHGMDITFTLDDGYGRLDQLAAVPRYMVKNDPDIQKFVFNIRQMAQPQPIRVVQLDLDYIYDDDAEQMNRNLDAVIQRIHDMKINTVFLQAFADPDGSGLVKSTYFPNRVLPMRADLMNRVTWQLVTRDHVRVYGWLPVLSFDFDDRAATVLAWNPDEGKTEINPKDYHRASPFDARARTLIEQLYEDLAFHAPIAGLLFHDDAMLTDNEDASPPALAAYQQAGFAGDIDALHNSPEALQRWTKFKTRYLIDFTKDLEQHAAIYRKPLLTVRNIYAPMLLKPESETWFAQNYSDFLKAYTYTAIEAMPRMENIDEADAHDWLLHLVDIAASTQPDALNHTIFELQAVDWRVKDGDRAVPVEELADQMRSLTLRGALNFGYYPDDFVTNTPDADALQKDFSLRTSPYLAP